MRTLSRLTTVVAELAGDIADVALSRECVGCGHEGPVLCVRCQSRLPELPARRKHEPPVWFAGEYEGLLRDLVIAHKERGVRALSSLLGGLLADCIGEAVPTTKSLVLVPIPAHRASLRSRGRDCLDEIARAAVKELRCRGYTCSVDPTVKWQHETSRHTGQSARSRMDVEGALVARSTRTAAMSVVVVDDVITTGATVSAAVAALAKAGVHTDAVCCVASRSLGTR